MHFKLLSWESLFSSMFLVLQDPLQCKSLALSEIGILNKDYCHLLPSLISQHFSVSVCQDCIADDGLGLSHLLR